MMKVLLLDVDGVVIQGEQFATHLEQQYGISRKEASVFFHGEFEQCLVGKADLKKILPTYLKRWGWRHSVEEVMQQWFISESSVDQQLIQYIQTLRQRGIQCCAATNQEKYRSEYLVHTLQFEKFFDAVFCSCTIGYTKRSQDFFQHIITALPDSSKTQIVFWDDALVHVQVAQSVGIHAELYETFEQFQRVMQQRYLQFLK